MKYKRCCIDRERELVRRADALEELFGLASMFPLLRPDCPELDAWLDAQRDGDVTRELIEEAGTHLPDSEQERIARAHAQEFPEVWRSLIDDFGDEDEAGQVVIIGAIVAALGEASELDPKILELIEDDEEVAADPAEVLALALDATDLWSIAEATTLDDVLAEIPEFLDDDAYGIRRTAAVEAEAARLWSPRHERRLRRLVQRVRAQLPIAESAKASATLAEACSAFERDEMVRTKVGAMLLADSLGPLQQTQIAAALAA